MLIEILRIIFQECANSRKYGMCDLKLPEVFFSIYLMDSIKLIVGYLPYPVRVILPIHCNNTVFTNELRYSRLITLKIIYLV